MINGVNDVIAKDPMHCSYYNTWWWNKEKSERLRLYDRILKNHSDYIFRNTVDAQEELRNYEMAKFTNESAKFVVQSLVVWFSIKMIFAKHKDPKKDFMTLHELIIGPVNSSVIGVAAMLGIWAKLRWYKTKDQVCDKYFSHLTNHHL